MDSDQDDLATKKLSDSDYLLKDRFRFDALKSNFIYKCNNNGRLYQFFGIKDFVEVELTEQFALGEVVTQNNIWAKYDIQLVGDSLPENHIYNIINQISPLNFDNTRLKFLINRRFDKKIEKHILINWCLRLMKSDIKVVKCLEYSCWSSRKKKIKTKTYRAAGTLNNTKIVDKEFRNRNGTLMNKTHRVSMAIGEIYEVITYRDAGVIPPTFCEHFFVNNCQCLGNTRFPGPKYNVANIVSAVKEVKPQLECGEYTPKDFFRERIYGSPTNSIFVFGLE